MQNEDAATGYLVWRLAMKWRAAVDRAVAPLGLTHARYSLLASLYGMSRTGARPSQRELADWTGLDPIYVSKLARALEQEGLLSRTEHPGDPRAVALEITEQGTETIVRAITIVHGQLDELTGPIGGLKSDQNHELVLILRNLLGISPGGSEKGTTS
jgi:MarR family transcriptional regulator, organic hydroperoxide resistance regulator